ncbi:MAG: ArsR/SmtB family transcription factor [Candidatus Odinarchaeia archaeon]
MSEDLIQLEAKFLKAISHPIRLKILHFLLSGEKCQCEIIPEIKKSQPTVSQHLQKLVEAGVLTSRKDGQKIFYAIKSPKIPMIIKLINETLEEELKRAVKSLAKI